MNVAVSIESGINVGINTIASGMNVSINTLGVQGPVGPSGATEIPSGLFYPLDANPSEYLTGFNSGLYVQHLETGILQSSGDYIFRSETGQFSSPVPTGNLTGAFYPLSQNPATYLTGWN